MKTLLIIVALCLLTAAIIMSVRLWRHGFNLGRQLADPQFYLYLMLVVVLLVLASYIGRM